jgi:hypothetical protein
LAAIYDISLWELGHTNHRENATMSQHHLDDIVFAFHLRRSQQTIAAARCARLVVRIFDHLRFPGLPSELKTFTRTVQLVEENAAGTGDETELDSSMNEIARIAFARLPQSRFSSDRIICYAAQAIYAAALSCMTGSKDCLEDAFVYTLEAVRIVQARDLGGSIQEELFRILREATRSSMEDSKPKRLEWSLRDRALADRLTV